MNAWFTEQVAREVIAERRRAAAHDRLVPRPRSHRWGQVLSRLAVPSALHRSPNALGCNA
ncbi:MAG: hypothetical protein QOG53_2214 [Frankiales bacterium]|jgi:hypothetical protein|nr:hypothetical protein [Frankiales bacterium]